MPAPAWATGSASAASRPSSPSAAARSWEKAGIRSSGARTRRSPRCSKPEKERLPGQPSTSRSNRAVITARRRPARRRWSWRAWAEWWPQWRIRFHRWTAAASLAATDLYACGTIIYPVLDLQGFAEETHDLESRYIDALAGPPDTLAVRNRERSPAARADRITAPFVLLQGLDDAVCPPAQAERFLRALEGRAVPSVSLGERTELGAAVGLGPVSALAVTSESLAERIAAELAEPAFAHTGTAVEAAQE